MIIKNLYFLILIPLSLYLTSCSEKSTDKNTDEDISFIQSGNYEGSYWPTIDWRTCSPAQIGMDSAKLMLAYDYATNPDFQTLSLLVIH